MDFIYTPEGREDDPYRWEWAPGRIPSPDAEIIERRTGMLFPKWTKAAADGSIIALHAFLFVQLRKQRPTLEWDQVVFTQDEVRFEFTEDDERKWLTNLEAAEKRGETLAPEEQTLLDGLRKQFSDQEPDPADEGGGEEPDPT
jgi:hypothetical protein